ncbi:tol-pal system protein YbgF [Vibrio metoecus]|uniref:tol-pal system protein YbgF n=1 Tax=Vibrio metoecus TaxID=1481663 RepID=UPI00215D17AB|nr:tol-pal system protein YbgF [Vibrio metoecus]MCR9385921.1 tol-pal system protein YbgF [Vibrio metoecus]
MFSNLKHLVMLMLLASAASYALAAPAPVSDLGSNGSSGSASGSRNSEIERLERLLESRNLMQLQMQKQLDDMALEVDELRGQIEKNNYDMQQMLQRQRELFVELDRLRGELKTPSAASQLPVSGSDDTAQGTFSSDANEQAAYQNAVDLILKKRDYAGAIAAFQKFQTDYPNSTFSANASYWLGQLYFAKKDDKEAAKSFIAVVSQKDSNKRADALVKLGDIAKRNNNAEQARKFYQQAIDEYPDSASAKIAKESLK